ncbi:MAG: selenocysteine-specific translation elongation factor [Deltaproteobacteria bacterium]|nr:selenocysteine-specific translation elongation factor [Deltaproteobacteria bacterium]
MPVIMGTAGHIDHGKTTLIKALTGINCDRLAEEQKRGITIELGFAFLDLKPGLRLGIIDVPGHERFVKNMVAGAAGIDFVVLVIAADEGIMPQTREHLDICVLLGVEQGLVALTKADMVDKDWLEMVQEEVAEYLEGSFLAGAPIIPVSAHTGAGLEELKAELVRMTEEFRPRRRSDLFRLPVDRVFTMRGHGTVVTGTSFSGTVAAGDEMEVYPRGLRSKVRSLQAHGEASERVTAGQRTAVNLYGLEVQDLERGDILAAPGSLFPSPVWDLELDYLASAGRSLKNRTQIHFHHGTREVLARIYLLDRDILEPGDRVVCQVRFEEPLTGVFGDRCIVRSFSPLQTIGGARIINPLGRKVKRFSKGVENLKKLAELHGPELVAAQLELSGPQGLTFAQLRIMTDMESKELERTLQQMGGRQEAFLFDRDQRKYVAGTVVRDLGQGLVDYLAGYHRRQPMRQGLGRGELESAWAKGLDQKLVHFLIERQARDEAVVVEQDLIRLPDHRVSLASDVAKARQSILDAFSAGGLTPPTLKVVLADLSLTPKEAGPILRVLQEAGELIKINEDLYFTATAIEGLVQTIRDFFADHEAMEPSDFKDLTGLSRKFAIPLLEYLDKSRITMRVGDRRMLRGV